MYMPQKSQVTSHFALPILLSSSMILTLILYFYDLSLLTLVDQFCMSQLWEATFYDIYQDIKHFHTTLLCVDQLAASNPETTYRWLPSRFTVVSVNVNVQHWSRCKSRKCREDAQNHYNAMGWFARHLKALRSISLWRNQSWDFDVLRLRLWIALGVSDVWLAGKGWSTLKLFRIIIIPKVGMQRVATIRIIPQILIHH